jgi:FtsP/CotA-like multicopper oxidase with cupredoxin domain
MHGHTFYIVREGPDEYDSILAKPIFDDNIARNKVQFRDVLTLFPNRSDNKTDGGTPCGWVAIRFVANNPGVWLAHCHRTADSIMGMMFILHEHRLQLGLLQTIQEFKWLIVIIQLIVLWG